MILIKFELEKSYFLLKINYCMSLEVKIFQKITESKSVDNVSFLLKKEKIIFWVQMVLKLFFFRRKNFDYLFNS